MGMIKELTEKIVKFQKKKQNIKNEKKSQNTNTFSVLFNFMNKEQKEEFYKLLKEGSVLRGKEMINSTQSKLGVDDNK